MDDNREVGFWEFNKNGLFTNMLQIEDHLSRLDDADNTLGHSQCVNKHGYFMLGELTEGISHALKVEPDKVPLLKDIRGDMTNLLDNLPNRSVEDNMIIARSIRKKVEKLDDKFNTAYCKACSINRPSSMGPPLVAPIVPVEEPHREMEGLSPWPLPPPPGFDSPPEPQDLAPQFNGPFLVPGFMIRKDGKNG